VEGPVVLVPEVLGAGLAESIGEGADVGARRSGPLVSLGGAGEAGGADLGTEAGEVELLLVAEEAALLLPRQLLVHPLVLPLGQPAREGARPAPHRRRKKRRRRALDGRAEGRVSSDTEMAEEERKRVLVVGGSGYLGQHLLAALAPATDRLDVAFTHRSQAPPQPLLDALPSVRAFRADLRSGDGLEAISASFGQPHVVVNCAAISVPRACEMDPPAAMATNVPSSLVNWLLSFGNDESLLIHLSTDQVYEGVKSFYKEEDETLPVNMYGKSKVAAEKFIVEKCSNYAILRSSIIYGPQMISPVANSFPIQVLLLMFQN